MNKDSSSLIDSLVDDLAPVRSLRQSDGGILVCIAAVLTGTIVVALNGLNDDILEGRISAPFLLANGLLLVLGLAASVSTVTMALPRVGARHEGPRWAMIATAVFPASAIAMLVLHFTSWPKLPDLVHGWRCFAEATMASLLIAGALIFWLRRGAPVSLPTAGLHLGVAATALGTFAFGLTCPQDTISHLGVWHAAPVVLGGVVGRTIGPRLLRW
ncbi:NrsF family protein [Novosphingobium sp. CECT 9465]|uniref:NrsF family protein n=1 Tax=Novosphingobium sp. CECT 9465 TaxID=2829794 RepID=UPI001E2D0981|nr:DUF1109 domain-containing protein [Novosphingobium sp. CECT 9465]CAH0495252.1 hypothetical protein NVSP9465_00258 [Novosphingobium sp. CECT 9465]